MTGLRREGGGRHRRRRWHRPGTRPRPAHPGGPRRGGRRRGPGSRPTAVDELDALGAVRGVRTDVADPDSVVALADDVYATEGRCDLLFANAGVTSGGGGLPWEQEINDWRWCFSVNVFGVAADRPHLPPPDARGGGAGRDHRHLVG